MPERAVRGPGRPAPLLCLALLLGAGCASAPDLRRDPVFAAGQVRLARTGAAVRQSGAAEDEQALFLQAESFYDYRFAFPPPSALGQLAAVAAASTDFAALQSLAGSLDLLDRRLGAYDSAAFLWEGFLRLHPASPLRSLALYRLGWTYRSTGAAGLPGDSAGSFGRLIAEAPDSALAGLARQAQAVPWRSKSTATLLSLLPGAGQVYAGEPANGSARLGVALAGLAAFLTPTLLAYQRRDDLSWQRDWPLVLVGTAGLVVLSVDYTLSYQDALRAVVGFNERREEDFSRAHPDAP